MKKTTILTITLFLFSITAFSQTTTVSGNITDVYEKNVVKNVVVMLLTPKDSVLYKFTRTDANGNFLFKNVKPDNYILMTSHPYFADIVDNIEVQGADKNLGKLGLTSKSKLLQEVIVKSGTPIKIKGDTTIYTADSFKVSANANVEELLKKLPGIQVDRDGKIKAMGETVEKVLVDGEEFFGDDPGMAVKNLRADAVKEVQVFDKKSEQAEFTGIDDGKTQKTINLKLKEDKKKGYFGKLDAAGGLQDKIDDRYNTNAMINAFKGKRKLSAFFLSGNTGQDGLSWQDNDKYGGDNDNMNMEMTDDGGVMMWRGGGSDDEPYVDTENGFIKNVNAGVNYNNKWNDKRTLNFSPKFNSQIYTNTIGTTMQEQINADSTQNTESIRTTDVNRNNFKTSGSFDIKLDSNNSLKITAKANFYNTQSAESSFSETLGGFKNLKNSSDKTVNITSDKQAISSSIIYKHKFKKARRTLSINTDLSFLESKADNYLQSDNIRLENGNLVTEAIDNFRDNQKASNKIAGKIIYTEPLGKKYAMELGYELSFTKGNNKFITYDYNTITNKYDKRVDTLSNDFDQTIVVNRPSIKFNYTGKKIKATLGSGLGITNFDFTNNSTNIDYTRNFTNLFPQASFTYTYKSNHNIRINYNGNTTQPTINQVQPLRNITDRFNQYIGNPNLKQSFSNAINLSHNSYNFIKDIWTYQSFNVRTTNNAITNNVVTNLTNGERITQPVNTNGNINASFWSGIGFKLKKLDLRVNLQPNFNFSKTNGFINNVKNISKTINGGFGFYLSKSKDKKYDISLGNDISANRNTISQSNRVNKFFTNNFNTNITVYYKKTWSIQSDFNFYSRPATDQIPTAINNKIWNAKLQKTFKNNEFTAYVLVRDILKENIGVDRNFYENTFTETRNERLQRYFMVGFTWDFKNKNATKK
ncbi:MAG: TonB-dependent receptor family protein [Ferruginibacter sp.]|nr:TonB-dependent receptor family protein [Ferruginibacter sp.]